MRQPPCRRNRSRLAFGMGALSMISAMATASLPVPDDFRQLSLEELMAIEVRAPSKIDLPLMEAPAIGGVVTHAEIEAYGWQTIGDILLRQPGFAPSQDYERVTFSARGQYESWNNNHLRLLVNGLPFNDFTNGTALVWEMFPLSSVESIEILRGPGSALYGSNATNGVLSINTKEVDDHPALRAGVGMGHSGQRRLNLDGGKDFGPVRFFGAYQYSATEGNEYESYDNSYRTHANGDWLRLKVHGLNKSHSGFVQVQGAKGLEAWSLQSHLAYWEFETGHGWLYQIPDRPDLAINLFSMNTLNFRPEPFFAQRLKLDLAAGFQYIDREYDIQFMPAGGNLFGAPLPDGLLERVHFDASQVYVHAQADYRIVGEFRALMGVEAWRYFIEAEENHQSNVDLNSGGSFQPFPDGEMHDLRSVSEAFNDMPFQNLGLFLQASSGKILRDHVSTTAGIRYDLLDAEYRDMTQSQAKVLGKNLDQVSPRIAVLIFPHSKFTLKVLAEKAFRTPTPGELFARNSLLGFSDPGPLKAETMTAYTLAVDATPWRNLNIRMDGFVQSFENQIAFSGSRNASSNIYSRTVNGVETCVRFEVGTPKGWKVTSFINHSLSHQLSETTLEPGLAHSDRLTWAPEHVANAGILMDYRRIHFSVQGHYQGTVYRRPSDYQNLDGTPTLFSPSRPRNLDPWVTLDLGLVYRVGDGLSVRLNGTNVLDEKGYLMKPGDSPFDYQIPGARVQGRLEYAFARNSGKSRLPQEGQ